MNFNGQSQSSMNKRCWLCLWKCISSRPTVLAGSDNKKENTLKSLPSSKQLIFHLCSIFYISCNISRSNHDLIKSSMRRKDRSVEEAEERAAVWMKCGTLYDMVEIHVQMSMMQMWVKPNADVNSRGSVLQDQRGGGQRLKLQVPPTAPHGMLGRRGACRRPALPHFIFLQKHHTAESPWQLRNTLPTHTHRKHSVRMMELE